MKQKEHTFSLTPKGFFMSEFKDEKKVTDFSNALELYMRRADYNAIVLHNNELQFIRVYAE